MIVDKTSFFVNRITLYICQPIKEVEYRKEIQERCDTRLQQKCNTTTRERPRRLCRERTKIQCYPNIK